MLLEPEAKFHTPLFPSAHKLTNIVTSPPLLTNDSSPTTMTDSLLLKDYDPDVNLNKPTPQPDDIPVFIVTDPPNPLYPPAPNDTTLVVIMTLQIITFSIVVLTTK